MVARELWLNNSGKRWADLHLSPGLPSSEALVWVLKQELRLELLHCVPSAGAQTGCRGEEHDFLFAILDQDIILADLFIWRADLAQLHKGKSLG